MKREKERDKNERVSKQTYERTDERPRVLKWKIHNEKWWEEKQQKWNESASNSSMFIDAKKICWFPKLSSMCAFRPFPYVSTFSPTFHRFHSIQRTSYLSLDCCCCSFFRCFSFGFVLQLICYEHTLCDYISLHSHTNRLWLWQRKIHLNWNFCNHIHHTAFAFAFAFAWNIHTRIT